MLEVVVASAIMSFMVATFAGLFGQITMTMRRVELRQDEYQTVSNFMNNIRTNFSNYQIDFGDAESIDKKLMVDRLPMVWSKSEITTPDRCDEIQCLGKLGFVIQPLDSVQGMYMVTVRVTNPRIMGDAFRDFKFMVTAK